MNAARQLGKGLVTLFATDATLDAGVVGGWHEELSPPGTESPWGIFQLLDGPDRYTHDGWSDAPFLYLIKLVAEGYSKAALWPLLERVHFLLQPDGEQAKQLTVAGYRILHILRRRTISLKEHSDGKAYSHAGFHYEIRLG